MKKNQKERTEPDNSNLPSNAANEPTPIFISDVNNPQTEEEYKEHKKRPDPETRSGEQEEKNPGQSREPRD